ncbi:anti-sigma factor [Flavobacteriaceae bacterium TK19130]|nr:anti-sigma factor [Thermobacterium salinum]
MTAEELRESGLLELYVSGSLSAEEKREVEEHLREHPELIREVEEIETSIISLAESLSPALPALIWSSIVEHIGGIRTLPKEDTSTNWGAITGWAAAILCIAGIFWMLNKNNSLRDSLQKSVTETTVLQEEKDAIQSDLVEAEEVLSIIRSKDFREVTLPGNQAVAPSAYAKVYFNKKDKKAYIDATGLPTPPKGKVYQVWSLTMEPLTPISMGLLDNLETSPQKLYEFEELPETEAFGITLEPEGGSETPTLEQLYTLGQVQP